MKRKLYFLIAVMMIAAMCLAVFAPSAFAEETPAASSPPAADGGPSEQGKDGESGGGSTMSELDGKAGDTTKDALYSAATKIRAFGTVLAVLAIVASGIQMIAGDEKTAAKAKTRIITIIIAVICMFAITQAMRIGRNSFGSVVPAWSPDNIK